MDEQTFMVINYIEIAINLVLVGIQILIMIFLFAHLIRPKSIFSSAYFGILNSVYFADIIFTIAWIYGHLTLYSNKAFGMPAVNIIQFHSQALLGIWEMFLAMNRCTAMAFPSLHKKLWTRNLAFLYIFIIQISPYIFHYPVFPNWRCKLFPDRSDICNAYDLGANKRLAIVNISFGLIALALIIFGVIASPKTSTTQTTNNINRQKMELRLIYQSIFSSAMLVGLYSCSFFKEYFHWTFFTYFSYALYLLQFYPPMFILFFISPVVREEFAKFYGLKFFVKFIKISTATVENNFGSMTGPRTIQQKSFKENSMRASTC